MDEIVKTHKVDIDKRLLSVSAWDVSPKMRKDVISYLNDYSNGKITRRVSVRNNGTIEKEFNNLKVALTFLKGLDKKNLELFLESLFKDKIVGRYGNPYTIRSKKAIIDALSKFVKWKGLDPSCLTLRIASKRPDPKMLTEEEVKRLFDAVDKPKYQYFLSVLYSSGCRAEEFINIRYSDIELPKGDESYVKLNLRNKFSKTHGRTIMLYGDNVLPSVKAYLNERINDGIQPEEQVFTIHYSSMVKWLKRLGRRVLNKNINFHLFRHSRATHLSDKLNRQQLCVYFGWDFSSPMPDVYIKRSGVAFHEINQKFDMTDREKLKLHIDAQDKKLAKFELLLNNILKLQGLSPDDVDLDELSSDLEK